MSNKKQMNLPNKLTVLRLCLVPIFVVIIALIYYISISTVGGYATDWANDGVFGDGWYLDPVAIVNPDAGDQAAYDADADPYDEAQEASKTELEKAREESAKAIDELNALKAEKARSELRQKVSKETGVPADLISGDDEEAMTANAKAIAEYAKKANTTAPADKGGAARRGGKSTADLFAEAISSIK